MIRAQPLWRFMNCATTNWSNMLKGASCSSLLDKEGFRVLAIEGAEEQ